MFINETLVNKGQKKPPKSTEMTIMGTRFTEIIAEYEIYDPKAKKVTKSGTICLDVYDFEEKELHTYISDALIKNKQVKPNQLMLLKLHMRALRDIIDIDNTEDKN